MHVEDKKVYFVNNEPDIEQKHYSMAAVQQPDLVASNNTINIPQRLCKYLTIHTQYLCVKTYLAVVFNRVSTDIALFVYILIAVQQYNMLYIGNNMEFDIPLLIVFGLLFTIWANTLFIASLDRVLFWYVSDGVYFSIGATLLVILVSTALALYYGVKRNNPKLVRCWYLVKIVECILMSIAFVLHCSYMFRWAPHFEILYGLPLLPFGIYLIVCAKKINNNMTSPSSIYQEMIIEPPTVPKV